MAMQYLHDGVHVAEGVRFIIKVFGEAGCVVIASECFQVCEYLFILCLYLC